MRLPTLSVRSDGIVFSASPSRRVAMQPSRDMFKPRTHKYGIKPYLTFSEPSVHTPGSEASNRPWSILGAVHAYSKVRYDMPKSHEILLNLY